MRNVFMVAVFAFLLSHQGSASNDYVTVKSKDHSCAELQEIITEHRIVHIKGFGSINVFAEQREACGSLEKCRNRKNLCDPFKTKWRTNDKKVCKVGYACRITPDRSTGT